MSEKLNNMIGVLEELTAARNPYAFRRHQTFALRAWRDHMANPALDMAVRHRGYIRMPTQTGKMYKFTRAAKAMRHVDPNQQIMIGVPFVSLLDQIDDELRESLGLTDSDIGYVYGEAADKKSELDKPVVLAIYNSVVNGVRNYRESFGSFRIDPRRYIMFGDETHRAMSTMRQNVMREFDMAYGFTATPDFGVNKRLVSLLGTEMYRLTLPKAIRQGALARGVRNWILPIQGGINLSDVRIIAEDLDDRQLEERLTQASLIKGIGDHYEENHWGHHGFVHLATTTHVDWFVGEMNRRFGRDMPKGTQFAVAYHSDNEAIKDRQTRKDVIDRFKAGKIKLLCDVRMARESVSVPSARFVYNATPTRSWIDAEQRARCIGFDPSHPTAHKYVYDLTYPGMRMLDPILYAQIMGSAELYQEGYEQSKPVAAKSAPRVDPDRSRKSQIGLSIPSRVKVIDDPKMIMSYARRDGREMREYRREYAHLPETDHPNGYLNAQQWAEWLGWPKGDEQAMSMLRKIINATADAMAHAKKVPGLDRAMYHKQLAAAELQYCNKRARYNQTAQRAHHYLEIVESFSDRAISAREAAESGRQSDNARPQPINWSAKMEDILARKAAAILRPEFLYHEKMAVELADAERQLFAWKYAYLRPRRMGGKMRAVLEPNPKSLVSYYEGGVYLSPLLRQTLSLALEKERIRSQRVDLPFLFFRQYPVKRDSWVWVNHSVLSILSDLGWQSDRLIVDAMMDENAKLLPKETEIRPVLDRQPELPPLQEWCRILLPQRSKFKTKANLHPCGIPALAIDPYVYPDLLIELRRRHVDFADRIEVNYVYEPSDNTQAIPGYAPIPGVILPKSNHPNGFLNRDQFAAFLGVGYHNTYFSNIWNQLHAAAVNFGYEKWWSDPMPEQQEVRASVRSVISGNIGMFGGIMQGAEQVTKLLMDVSTGSRYARYEVCSDPMPFSSRMNLHEGRLYINPAQRLFFQENCLLDLDFPECPPGWLPCQPYYYYCERHAGFVGGFLKSCLPPQDGSKVGKPEAYIHTILSDDRITHILMGYYREPQLVPKEEVFCRCYNGSNQLTYGINIRRIPGLEDCSFRSLPYGLHDNVYMLQCAKTETGMPSPFQPPAPPPGQKRNILFHVGQARTRVEICR